MRWAVEVAHAAAPPGWRSPAGLPSSPANTRGQRTRPPPARSSVSGMPSRSGGSSTGSVPSHVMRRHDDEHRRPLARLHEERHLGPAGAGLELDEVEPALAARGAQAQRALRAGGDLAAAHGPLAADPPDRPAVRARAGVDEEVRLLARGDRAQRRLGGERAHGDPGRAGRVAGVEGHPHRVAADVAGAVADAHLHHVDAGRHRLAARAAVPDPAPQARRAACPWPRAAARPRRCGSRGSASRCGGRCR